MIQYYTRFFGLAFVMMLFQILIFDHINLFGFSNPAVYLILLIVYRLTQDQFGFIFIGFVIGFLLDLLTQTAGAHSIACVSTAFVRPVVSRFALGANYDQPHAMFTCIYYFHSLSNSVLLHEFLIGFQNPSLLTFLGYFAHNN